MLENIQNLILQRLSLELDPEFPRVQRIIWEQLNQIRRYYPSLRFYGC